MKDCGIVKDLLPLVAEHMASEESTAFVEEHLKTCADCKAAFDAMQAPVETEPAAPLKTVRKAVKKRGWLIAGLIACLVAALIFGGFARLTKPIPITAPEVAFAEATVLPETIPLPAPQAEKTQRTAQPTEPETPAATPKPETPAETPQKDAELEMVKDLQMQIILMTDDGEKKDIGYVVVPSVSVKVEQGTEKTPHVSIGYTIVIPEATEMPDGENGSMGETPKSTEAGSEKPETVAYVYSVPDPLAANGQTIEPEAVIASTPKTLKLTPKWGTTLQIERTGNEISIGAYTSLWDMRHPHAETPQEIDLSGVDAVFFEPYDNTERKALYVRDGYTPESGFALPRLVMNYYLLIAIGLTVALFVPWLVLLLTKKKKARRVFDVLLILAGSFVIAFLAAGFPATTIAPVRELAFVLVIALLLIGAGLCGRKLLRKE